MNDYEDTKLLKDMVSIYSPTGETEKIGEFLISLMNGRGFDAKDFNGNVVGTIGTGEMKILLVSHMDTVPGKVYIRQTDGKLYGRGTVDAKGSLAAMICAASRFSRNNRVKITVVGVPDEESVSLGAKRILKEFSGKVNYCVNGEPSGWDAITIGYKGILSFEYRKKVDQIHYSKQRPITFDIIEFIGKLREKLDSNEYTFDSTNLEIRELNCTFNEATMSISIRLPDGSDVEEIKQFLVENSDDGDIRFIEELPPIVVDKKNKLVSGFLNAIREMDGDPVFKRKTGTSDMNILKDLGCPIVTYGPGDSKLDHTDNEHIYLEEFKKSVDVLENVIRELSE